jgi:hypothetical protein
MLLNSEYYTPATLSTYARAAAMDLAVNKFTLNQWLPNKNIDDLTYRFVRGGDSLIEAATYRSYDAESSIAGRPGVTRVSGELPPISRKIVLGEYDRLRQRANPDSSIRDAILSDAERVTRQILARLEVARGDALVNGEVTINEDGVVATVDFGRDSTMEVTAGTLWSTTASADPISDLQTWTQAYVDRNGEPPGVLLTSTRVRGLLLQNAAIRTMAGNINGVPTLVSPDTLNQVLSSYDLPRLVTYDARYAIAGVSTRVVDDHFALLLPAPVDANSPDGTDLGATFYGTTAESLDPSFGLSGQEAGLAVGTYRKEDPISLWTKAAAIALPVLATPDLAMRAIVATNI